MREPLCIYHANCVDGFAAAWIVRRYFRLRDREVDFFPAQYGDAPPAVKGRDVIMVDFSYKRPVLETMALWAHTILVIDHHKTAAEDLAGYPVPVLGHYEPDSGWRASSIIHALFTMSSSGAGLAWDYFFPGEPRPRLINHVEDRDLWRFKLAETRDLHACIASHPYDFDVWDRLMAWTELPPLRFQMTKEGEAIDRKLQKDIASILSVPPRRMVIGGVSVPVVNAPGIWASDAAGKLAEGAPFAAVYFDMPHARVFSLRSRGDDGADVSEIAKRYGGGGHRNAAGFQAPIGWEGDTPC